MAKKHETASRGEAGPLTPPEHLMPWQVMESRSALNIPGRLQVLRQKVLLPDGSVVNDFYQVELGEYAVVFAETAEGSVVAEWEYKHGPKAICICLPAGLVEAGEAPLAAGKRELLEETGYAAENWEHMGTFTQNGNQGCGRGHFFRAGKASFRQAPVFDRMEEIQTVLLSHEEVRQAIRSGQVAITASVTGFLLGLNGLGATPPG